MLLFGNKGSFFRRAVSLINAGFERRHHGVWAARQVALVFSCHWSHICNLSGQIPFYLGNLPHGTLSQISMASTLLQAMSPRSKRPNWTSALVSCDPGTLEALPGCLFVSYSSGMSPTTPAPCRFFYRVNKTWESCYVASTLVKNVLTKGGIPTW